MVSLPVHKGADEPQTALEDGHHLPQVGSEEASSTAAFKSVVKVKVKVKV